MMVYIVGRFIIAGLFLLFFFSLFMTGRDVGIAGIQKDAIQNNAAYYSVDPKTGITEFRWGKP